MKTRRLSFSRFRDLQASDLQCDLHVHTHRTDGEASVDAVLRTATERKLHRVAFTEHVRRDSGWFPGFASEVREKARAYPHIEVLVGCETKALDTQGALDVTNEILADCDIVLGSVHRFPDGAGGYLDARTLEPKELAQIEFELAMGIVRSAQVDVLAHPGGMYARRQAADLPNSLMRRLIEECSDRGVAVEINSSYVRDLDAMLTLLHDLNPCVSIGSDMHRLRDLGHCRDLLMEKMSTSQ